MNNDVKIIKDYENEKYSITSIQELVELGNNIKIDFVTINCETCYQFENMTVRYVSADFEHPLVLKREDNNGNYSLYIDPVWYMSNRDKVDDLIAFVALHTKSDRFMIRDSILINPKLIDSLCANETIKEVDFGLFSKSVYTLTTEDYLKFKKSGKSKVYSSELDEELKENFDPLIRLNALKKLISFYDYEYLNKDDAAIYLNDLLKPEEIENLKYIGPNVQILLYKDSSKNVIEVCNKLKELNKNNKVIVKVDDKIGFNNLVFNSNIHYENLFVKAPLYEAPFSSYIRMEKLLYQIVEPAKNFSPFEKFIYVYNIVKRFKKYRESENNPTHSRNVYDILENEYMVCVGYSNLLGNLCEKLGLETSDLSVAVDVSYDENKSLDESIVSRKGYHARRYIHIRDEKYGLDGYYISDPTWDNSNDNDYYNHMVLTDEESTSSKRYLMISGTSEMELFNIKSIEEFYEKFKFILNRRSNDTIYSKKTYNEVVRNLIDDILCVLRKIDISFIKTIENKYPYITKPKLEWDEDFGPLINELANHIVHMVNKMVSGEIIMSAVYNVYKLTDIFGEKTDEEFRKTLEVNKQRQLSVFPRREKEYETGIVEEDTNGYNKFDIDVNLSKGIQK